MKATKKTASAYCHWCDYGICKRKRCKNYKWNASHSLHREKSKLKRDTYKEVTEYYNTKVR